MHVANKESDFEAFASVEENILGDSIEKTLEFDLLSGILDSEARELDKFTTTLQADVTSAGEIVSSLKHLGENFMEMEGKVRDAEQSLKESQDQVSEIRKQSTKFQRIIPSSNQDDNRSSVRGADFPEDDDLLNMNAKIQTAGHQRHVLRMLEKSLAREIDLEKKLTESRQIEEELKLRLHSSEQEVFYLEEEAADVWGRWFQADNTSQVLLGISKELLGRLQIFQFNLNGSLLRESELRSKLEPSTEQLKAKEIDFHKLKTSSADLNDSLLARTNSLKARLRETEDILTIANSEAFTLREKVSADGSRDQHNVLSSEINEMEDLIVDLQQKSSEAESRVESTKSKCKMLGETNMDLNEIYEELCFLEGSNGISDKVNSLERLLRESNIQLQHVVVSAEASQEKQSMLYSIIGDMENLIKDLKLKVSKAEIRVTTVEEKCVILSESNAQLKEELRFLRGRLESLEASLHQSKDMKMAIARDIGIRTKVIADLVMQLTIERERLHKQVVTNFTFFRLKYRWKDNSLIYTNILPNLVMNHLFARRKFTTCLV
ncbi:hypothetical protein I3842_04G051000 [Carya illinoinensis]|uniref:WIT1/2 N-terminal helical bundle domain-containing protein n=1 Tax=Carya illinoinensis TaxID=32201 RepID=A0A922FAR8_CARIL|nr:hypothetical protein I3842_04G051000 [Carya illinoinensis]